MGSAFGFWEVVAVRDFGIFGAVGDRRAVDPSSAFDIGFGLAADTFGVVVVAKFFGAIVAVLLEGFELDGDAVKHIKATSVILRIGGEEFSSLRGEKELGELSGGGLKADFGEFAGVVAAEKIDEVVLTQVEVKGVFLGEAPFAIATAGFPVGDVATGDMDAYFVERLDDPLGRQVVEEHPVDHVALGFWEASDFAVARAP